MLSPLVVSDLKSTILGSVSSIAERSGLTRDSKSAVEPLNFNSPVPRKTNSKKTSLYSRAADGLVC